MNTLPAESVSWLLPGHLVGRRDGSSALYIKTLKGVKSGDFAEACHVGGGGSEVIGLVFAIGLVYCVFSFLSFKGNESWEVCLILYLKFFIYYTKNLLL